MCIECETEAFRDVATRNLIGAEFATTDERRAARVRTASMALLGARCAMRDADFADLIAQQLDTESAAFSTVH